MDKSKTGEIIKNARIQKGFTQMELGEILGVSNKAISRWETGESFPDIGMLENIASTLDLNIDEIVLGESTDFESEALKKALHLAKIQIVEKRRTIIINALWIIALIVLIFLFSVVFVTNQAISWHFVGDCILFVVILVSLFALRTSFHDSTHPYDIQFKKILFITPIVLIVYDMLVILGASLLFSNGRYVINIAPANVGPVTAFLLGMACIISLFLIGIIGYRYIILKEIGIAQGIICLGSYFISLACGQHLYDLVTLEDFLIGIIIKLIILIAITCVALIINKNVGELS